MKQFSESRTREENSQLNNPNNQNKVKREQRLEITHPNTQNALIFESNCISQLKCTVFRNSFPVAETSVSFMDFAAQIFHQLLTPAQARTVQRHSYLFTDIIYGLMQQNKQGCVSGNLTTVFSAVVY